ncbi:MAG: endo-1,4-beta-xylanase [Planctomycetota bacterium]
MKIWLAALLSLTALSLPVLAKTPLPAGGVSHLSSPSIETFELFNYGPDQALSSMRLVDVSGQTFDRAMRITVNAGSESYWHTEVKTREIVPVTAEDTMFFRCFARAIEVHNESRTAEIMIYLQHAGRPFDPSFMRPVSVGSEWQELMIPFTVFRSYAEGSAELNFGVSKGAKTIEIGGIELIGYGRSLDLQDLPITRVSYVGIESDAPWREAALHRIETHRKGDLLVEVVDEAGRPVADAGVMVRMTKPAFRWGSAVGVPRLLEQSEDGERYRQAVLELFDIVAIENGLKWIRWENPRQRAETMQALEWLNEHEKLVHAHVLVWPSWEKSRVAGLEQMAEDDPEALRVRVADHIRDITTVTQDLVDEWDVVNEPISNNDMLKVFGDEIMAEWFDLAREYHPTARLFLNETGILAAPVGTEADRRHARLREIIDGLQARGAPVEALGLQGHFAGDRLAPMPKVVELLDSFASFGLPIAITEFDLFTDDKQFQAQFTRDFMIAAFAEPAVDSFIMWGFWDGHHWRADAPIYNADWSLKPSGEVWKQLVREEWWTDEIARTDTDGTARIRGFLGEHEVVVQAGRFDDVVLSGVDIDRSGSRVRVVME